MTVEQLLLLLLFIVFPLLQRLAPWLRRRLEELERRGGAPDEQAGPRSAPPPVAMPRVEHRAAEPPRPRAARPVEAPPSRLDRPRFAVGDLRDVRRGVVLMAILGPCRAWSPVEGPE